MNHVHAIASRILALAMIKNTIFTYGLLFHTCRLITLLSTKPHKQALASIRKFDLVRVIKNA